MVRPFGLFATALIASCTIVLGACSSTNKNDNTKPQCSDGVDNDGDGQVDFPDDPGCTSASDDSENSQPLPACSDGKDNDGDGKIDYPNDPGCTAPNQDDETDDCPSGPHCPQCSDGIDNDGNGATDYPGDPSCTSAAGPLEASLDPKACGTTITIKDLPMSGMDSGTFDAVASSSTVPSTCGDVAGVAAVAYRVMVSGDKTLVATTDGSTTADTVIDVRSARCSDTSSEIACNDNDATGPQSTVTADVHTGLYYVIVKGRTTTEAGTYTLTVHTYKPLGAPCADASECAPDDRCRIPHGGTAMVCAKPVCSDGLDDDADTKIDFPNDPGCSSAQDDTEDDDCPNGPNCPACSNGKDDDHDGQTDYPNDTSCTSAAGGSEACATETDPLVTITSGTTTTTLAGMHDDEQYPDTCGQFGSSGTGGLDRMFLLTVPNLRTLQVDTQASSPVDLVLSLLPGATCAQPALVCNEDYSNGATVTLSNVSATTYVVYLDAYADYTSPLGPFDLHVSGELLPGASCEPADTMNGAFTCGAAFPCAGTAGSRICTPTVCSDGMDNDHDGKTDYPNDPGCASPEDTDETDDCPNGPNCPVCSNGKDDDHDGHTDYPDDAACSSAAGTTESCVESDPIVVVSMGTTNYDTTTAHDDRIYTDACTTAPPAVVGGLDLTFQVDLPAVTSVTMGTLGGNDAVISLYDASCGGGVVACDDEGGSTFGDALFTAGPLAAGTYYLVVDGYTSSAAGPGQLVISGTLAQGASCELNKTLNGALTCPAAHPCSGTAGSKTCQ